MNLTVGWSFFQEWDFAGTGFPDGFLWQIMKKLAYGGETLVPKAAPTGWKKTYT